MTRRCGFRHLTPVMVRLPLLTLADYRRFFARPDGDDSLVRRIWSDERLREAVLAANPELAEVADRAGAGAVSERRLRSLAAALSNYAIRICSRPTPFGLFAGVGLAAVGPNAARDPDQPLHRTGHTTVSSPGPRLLDELATRVETDPAALPRLVLAHNPTLRRGPAGIEVIAGSVQDAGAGVAVRRTPVLDLVLECTRTPVSGTELLAALERHRPATPRAVLSGYVLDLVARGVLVTSARPAPGPGSAPGTRPGADGDTTHGARLTRVRELLAEYDRTPIGSGAPLLRELHSVLGRTRRGQVSTDLLLALDGTVPESLVRALTRAADALQALARTVPGSAALAGYARAFEARFGHEELPLLDLLDPVRGLGPPPGYPGGPPAGPRPEAPHLDALRRAMVARALDGVAELRTEDLDALPAPVRAPVPSGDLFATVALPDPACAVIGPRGCAFPAGRAFSRFAHLDRRIARHARSAAEPERAANPDVLFADVEYRYPDPDLGDLVAGVAPHPTRILTTALGATGEEHLRLGDIAVGTEDGTWYLRSMVDGRRILARSHHLLSLRQAPNAVRFLREVSDDGFAVPGWTWGRFTETHLALPRVRVGEVVVAPACWRVPEAGWTAPTFDRWCREVPRFVHVGHRDNRLLLDLEVRAHREELRAQIGQGATHVEEAPLVGAERIGEIGEAGEVAEVAEVVVSMVYTDPPVLPPLPVKGGVLEVRSRARQPGDRWWSLHLHGHRARQDEAVAALRAGLAVLGAEWFFVRYNAPVDHLRIRVRTGTAPLEELCALARRLYDRELVGRVSVEPYEPDVQRLGGPERLACAERLFSAETPAVVDALAELSRPGAGGGLDRVGVGCLFAAAYLDALGVGRAEVDEVLARTAASEQRPVRRGRQRAEEHAQRRLLVELLTDTGHPPELAGLRAAITRIQRAVHQVVGQSCPLTDPAEVGPERTLLHLHLNRLGFSRVAEGRIGARLLGTRHHTALRTAGAVGGSS